MEKRIEICANPLESALYAEEAKANRVELCAGMPEGGTTPSYGTIKLTCQQLTIPVHVIIRPRGGDFHYSQDELDIMREDILLSKELGAAGVVIGCLTPEGDIDMKAMQYLMEVCEGLSVTFHRAFDMCRDAKKGLEQIISLGCNRILTSGQEANALKGAELLRSLVEQANGRIIIMPGCGVGAKNIKEISEITGASEFHLSARTDRASEMVYKNPNVSMGGTVVIDEYKIDYSSPEIIRNTIAALNK